MLLMTCLVRVIAPDDTVTQVRALLDSAASTSLISEGFANVACHCSKSKISGVAGIDVHRRSIVNFKVAGVLSFPRSQLTYPHVQFLFPRLASGNTLQIWNSGIYGTPSRVDILFNGKVFSI